MSTWGGEEWFKREKSFHFWSVEKKKKSFRQIKLGDGVRDEQAMLKEGKGKANNSP